MIDNIYDCLEVIPDKHFFIQDANDNNPAFIKNDNGQFEVINTTQGDINFLKIDDCIYSSQDETRCDCAVFNDKVFCFIELKTCKIKNQKAHRETADKQLKETIIRLKNESIAEDKNLEAYTCLTCKIDNQLTRITKTRHNNTILEFKEDLNTRLYYNCKKEFK